MLKPETTRKRLAAGRARLLFYMGMSDEEFARVHVSISLKNSKLGKCLNVSLLPGETCPNCSACVCDCYAVNAMRYPVVIDAWARNTAIARRDPDRFFAEVRDAILHHPSYRGFRWQVSGDVESFEYWVGMVKTADMFPDRKFWGYSKSPFASRGEIRPNFHMQDSTGFDKEFNPDASGQFHCRMPGTPVPAGVMECPRDCSVCLAHEIGCPAGHNVWIDLHN